MKRRAAPSETRVACAPSSLLPTAVAASVLAAAFPSAAAANGSLALTTGAATQVPEDVRKTAVAPYLRHLYFVYFGIRACAEMNVAQNDRSMASEVSLEEARRTLKSLTSRAPRSVSTLKRSEPW